MDNITHAEIVRLAKDNPILDITHVFDNIVQPSDLLLAVVVVHFRNCWTKHVLRIRTVLPVRTILHTHCCRMY